MVIRNPALRRCRRFLSFCCATVITVIGIMGGGCDNSAMFSHVRPLDSRISKQFTTGVIPFVELVPEGSPKGYVEVFIVPESNGSVPFDVLVRSSDGKERSLAIRASFAGSDVYYHSAMRFSAPPGDCVFHLEYHSGSRASKQACTVRVAENMITPVRIIEVETDETRTPTSYASINTIWHEVLPPVSVEDPVFKADFVRIPLPQTFGSIVYSQSLEDKVVMKRSWPEGAIDRGALTVNEKSIVFDGRKTKLEIAVEDIQAVRSERKDPPPRNVLDHMFSGSVWDTYRDDPWLWYTVEYSRNGKTGIALFSYQYQWFTSRLHWALRTLACKKPFTISFPPGLWLENYSMPDR